MDEEKKSYTKMSALVGQEFTVHGYEGIKYVAWLQGENRFHVSDTPLEGHQKKHTLITDKGYLDVSQSQLGSLLEGIVSDGKSDIIGKTYTVKSNGKTGMEIRYWLNPVKAGSQGGSSHNASSPATNETQNPSSASSEVPE